MNKRASIVAHTGAGPAVSGLAWAAVLATCISAGSCSKQASFSTLTKQSLTGSTGRRVSEEFDPVNTRKETITIPAPTAVDLLWVIDNSGSMENYQKKLLDGVDRFVNQYLVGTGKDIRLSVITTDTWMAGKEAPDLGYVCGKTIRYSYPASFARLIPGIHDGIVPRIGGEAAIGTVDDAANVICPTQANPIVNPRSGRPILSTKDVTSATDIAKLVADFKLNAKVGVFGYRSERGMQSIAKLLTDNEVSSRCRVANPDPSCFFRKSSARGLIFVSDECDKSGASTMSADGDSGGCRGYSAQKTYKPIFDQFFQSLDGRVDPRYFVVSVINSNGSEYQYLTEKLQTDTKNTLGSKSVIRDIDSANYDGILDGIGKTIQDERDVTTIQTVFDLKEPLADAGSVKVVVIKSDGTRIDVDPLDFSVSVSPPAVTMSEQTLKQLAGDNDRVEISYLTP